MSDTENDEGSTPLEREIRGAVGRGDLHAGMTLALQGYGPELLGYLHATARTPSEADELYGDLCERLWRSLPEFRWQSRFRTWCYRIARNLVLDRRRSLRGPAGRVGNLADAPALAQLAEHVRSTTAAHLRTANKDKLAALRASLEPDDHTLLILRVDRALSWRDIAGVLADVEDPAVLAKAAARLRKRFERLKDRLRGELSR